MQILQVHRQICHGKCYIIQIWNWSHVFFKCRVLWVIWEAIPYQRHDIRPVCWEQSRLYIYTYIHIYTYVVIYLTLVLRWWHGGFCVTLLHSSIPIIKNIAFCVWNALVFVKTITRGISTIDIWYVYIYIHIYANDYGIKDFEKMSDFPGSLGTPEN